MIHKKKKNICGNIKKNKQSDFKTTRILETTELKLIENDLNGGHTYSLLVKFTCKI